MDSRVCSSLAKFCADQYRAFNPRAWIGRSAVDGKAIAVAAKYLSMTSWYGHAEALERIATGILPGIGSITDFYRELHAIGLDLAHFSVAVRHAIALGHAEQAYTTG